tara:strand:- start:123 stop:323 length:201 start_codon:yes stop_codon:yes gene_type:complete
MLKIFIGVVLGYLLFTSPQARRITGALLRSAAEAISPETEPTKPSLNAPKTAIHNIPLEVEQPNIQ